ncbi:MAG: glycosyltransferase, partial [Leeuwenhoekiella sp.]
MRPLKVVHIVEALGGGIYSYFVNLTHSFGHLENVETTIVFSDKRKEIDPKRIYEDFNKNIKLIKVSMKKELSPRADYNAFIKIKEILKNINPDVIHLHSSKAGVLGRAAYYFSGSDAQLYYTPHGYSFLRKDISIGKKAFYFCIEKFTQKVFGGKTIACGDTELTYSERIGPVTLVRNS